MIKKKVTKKVVKKISKKVTKKVIKKISNNKVPKKVIKKVTKKVASKVVKKTSKIISQKTKTKISLKKKNVKLNKIISNPILSPSMYAWENEAVFNPGALYCGSFVHLFYRAVGSDGISRIGYARSKDGINFDQRLFYPIYSAKNIEENKNNHFPWTSPARLVFDKDLYSSGGSWGGAEDPRVVLIDGMVYITFNMFNGWHSLRVAVISIKEENLLNNKFIWEDFSYLSHKGDRQKNWVLFPEKINGKFAVFHNLDMNDSNPNHVGIAYSYFLNSKDMPRGDGAPDPQLLPDNIIAWHKRTRSAATPPIKTKDGWLLLYHAMDKDGSSKYKLGAMLLDLNDPSRVLYRAISPILEPEEWYENDYKPGVIYASGAIVKDGILFVYYGGGDKYIAVATIDLDILLDSIKNQKEVKLKKVKK